MGEISAALPTALSTVPSGLSSLSSRWSRIVSVLSHTSVPAFLAGASDVSFPAATQCTDLPDYPTTHRQELRSLGQSGSLWLITDQFSGFWISQDAAANNAGRPFIPWKRQRTVVCRKHVGWLDDREHENREGGVERIHDILVLVVVLLVVLFDDNVAEVPVPRLR